MLVGFLVRGVRKGPGNAEEELGRVFIIHDPAHSSTFSPEALLSCLLSMIGSGTEENEMAARLLARVEILRVFDFEGMGEAVGEVSERIYAEREKGEKDGEVLVVVGGIDRFTKRVIERSNAARGNALLGGLLRRVGVLARREEVRVVVVNDGVGVGGSGAGSRGVRDEGKSEGAGAPNLRRSVVVSRIGGGADGESSGGEGKGGISTETEEEQEAGDDTDGMEESTTEPPAPRSHPPEQQPRYQRQNQHPSSIFLHNQVNHGHPSGLYLVFNKTLDQGIDTHFLVSRIQGQGIVEVAKDRVGDGVGRWCIWE